MDKGLTRLANDLKKFIVDNKFNVIFTFILGFTTFGIRIIYLNYGMDTLNYMYDNNEYLNHWIKIGRPGMYFFKKLFGPYMNIWLANLSFVIFLCITSLGLCFLATKKLQFREVSIGKSKLIIIPSVLVTSPLFVQQYYFDLQNFEFSFSMSLIVIAVISSLYSYFFSKRGIIIFQVICFLIAFSVYQSFPILVCVLIIFCMYLDLYCDFIEKSGETIRKLSNKYLHLVLSIVTSFLLYELFEKLMLFSFGLRKSGYLTGQILWFHEPVEITFRRILLTIKSQLFTGFTYSFNISLIVGIFLVLIIWIFKYILDNNSLFNTISFLVLLISLVILVFLFVLLLGNEPASRAYVPVYPVTSSLLLFISALFIKRRSLLSLLTIIVSIVTVKQLILTTNLLQADQFRYEQDLQLINRIETSLDSRHINPETHKLMLIGYRDNNTSLNIEYDVVGMSMIKFGYFKGISNAMTMNVVKIMNLNGYNIKSVNSKEYKKLYNEGNRMQKFPEKESVLVKNDVVIVKIN